MGIQKLFRSNPKRKTTKNRSSHASFEILERLSVNVFTALTRTKYHRTLGCQLHFNFYLARFDIFDEKTLFPARA
jgi:hypothetical protein